MRRETITVGVTSHKLHQCVHILSCRVCICLVALIHMAIMLINLAVFVALQHIKWLEQKYSILQFI